MSVCTTQVSILYITPYPSISNLQFQICYTEYMLSLSILESVAYEFGPGRGLITFTYPEDRRPEMKSDVIALGFITNKEDAVLLRIDSGTSNDYMELEIVSTLTFVSQYEKIYFILFCRKQERNILILNCVTTLFCQS